MGKPFPGAAAPFKKGGGRAVAPGQAKSGGMSTPGHVRTAVAAMKHVPPHKQDAAKKKIMGAARKIPGAMAHIPPAWAK